MPLDIPVSTAPFDTEAADQLLQVANIRAPKGKYTVVHVPGVGVDQFILRNKQGQAAGILSIADGKVETLYVDKKLFPEKYAADKLYSAAQRGGHDIATLGADEMTTAGRKAREGFLQRTGQMATKTKTKTPKPARMITKRNMTQMTDQEIADALLNRAALTRTPGTTAFPTAASTARTSNVLDQLMNPTRADIQTSPLAQSIDDIRARALATDTAAARQSAFDNFLANANGPRVAGQPPVPPAYAPSGQLSLFSEPTPVPSIPSPTASVADDVAQAVTPTATSGILSQITRPMIAKNIKGAGLVSGLAGVIGAGYVDQADIGGANSPADRFLTGATAGAGITRNPYGALAAGIGNLTFGSARDSLKEGGFAFGSAKGSLYSEMVNKALKNGDTAAADAILQHAADNGVNMKNIRIDPKLTAQTGVSSEGHTSTPLTDDQSFNARLIGAVQAAGFSDEAKRNLLNTWAMHNVISQLSDDPEAYMANQRNILVQNLPQYLLDDQAAQTKKKYDLEEKIALQEMLGRIMEPAAQGFEASGNLLGSLYGDLATRNPGQADAYNQQASLARLNATNMANAARLQTTSLPSIYAREREAQALALAAQQQAQNQSSQALNIQSILSQLSPQAGRLG